MGTPDARAGRPSGRTSPIAARTLSVSSSGVAWNILRNSRLNCDGLSYPTRSAAIDAPTAVDGTITLVGAPENPMPVSAFPLIMGRRSFAGSGIGGLRETQEMLDFCAEHNIVSDIEMIDIDQINEAYERLLKSDVKYRFVIDMASLKG